MTSQLNPRGAEGEPPMLARVASPPFLSGNTNSLKRSTSPDSLESEPSPQKRPRVASSASTLRPLPLPLLLLASAHSLHASALALQPNLAHPATYTLYTQQLAACATILRRLLALGSSDSGGRIDLRARVMLVEVLALTDGRPEADRLIAKGLSAATHETHKPFKQLLFAQAAALAFTPAAKFARATLKRAIVDSPPHWTYQHLLTLSAHAADFATALSSLREVERIAAERGDESVLWASKVIAGRMALGEGKMKIAAASLEGVAAHWFGSQDGDTERELPLPRAVQIQFLLAYALLLAYQGEPKLAKERLKRAHALLDSRDYEDGELEGWCRINLKGAGPTHLTALLPTPHFIVLRVTPRTQVYAFAFLVSAAVHRDPFGTSPRSLLFASEGLKSPLLSPSARVHLHLLLAELHILRSSPDVAREHILSAVASSASSQALWSAFQPRITLGFGALYVSLCSPRAIPCFNSLILSLPPTSPYHYLGQLSLSLVSPQPLPLPDTPEGPALLLGQEILIALSRPEITRAKQHFSTALAMANKAGMNHVKAILLSLLANLFLWTRNDQAQKMLHAAFHIARGMGDRKGEDAAVGNARLGLWVGSRLLESYKKEGDVVKATAQIEANAAHLRVLLKEGGKPITEPVP